MNDKNSQSLKLSNVKLCIIAFLSNIHNNNLVAIGVVSPLDNLIYVIHSKNICRKERVH